MNVNKNIKTPLVDKYPEELARLDKLFKTYQEIYILPEYIHIDRDVLPKAMQYAKKRKYFVILVLYTKEGYVCYHRSFDNGHLSMNLPGGSIKFEKKDTIIDAIIRVAKKSFKDNLQITDISPIISLKNQFICTDGEQYEHVGLGVRALLHNEVKDIKSILDKIIYRGNFCKDFPSDQIPHPPAKATYEVFTKWFNSKGYSTATNEIDAQHNVMYNYGFHNKIIKPVFKLLSHFIGKYTISQYKAMIADKLPQTGKVIDVACGDDQSVFELARQVNLFVANDICVDQIANLKLQHDKYCQRYPKSHSLIFTNHDCLDLPFRDKVFDSAICRNVMHHISPNEDLNRLFNNLKRVAKKVLVVDIQNPKDENIFARIRHWYYLRFLKDEGKYFYSKAQFEKTIRDEFTEKEYILIFEYLPTIRAVYMVAEIESTFKK